MKFGLFIGNFGYFIDPAIITNFAIKAEDLGWDGIFLADHLHYGNQTGYDDNPGYLDPWIMLTALATQTSKIKLGTWITPIPRRLPWQLARNLATLDHISNGRVILGGGLGSPPEDYEDYGIPYHPKELATKMDECLDIITGLWGDEEFSYSGEYYNINSVDLHPKPVQQPRIPIMIAGRWPSRKPIDRGARWDGIMPIGSNFPQTMEDEEIREMVTYFRQQSQTGEIMLPYQVGSPAVPEFIQFCRDLEIDWVLFSVGPMIGSIYDNMDLLRTISQEIK